MQNKIFLEPIVFGRECNLFARSRRCNSSPPLFDRRKNVRHHFALVTKAPEEPWREI
jgi:hypothetical protein